MADGKSKSDIRSAGVGSNGTGWLGLESSGKGVKKPWIDGSKVLMTVRVFEIIFDFDSVVCLCLPFLKKKIEYWLTGGTFYSVSVVWICRLLFCLDRRRVVSFVTFNFNLALRNLTRERANIFF